jgi:hypothetical protein
MVRDGCEREYLAYEGDIADRNVNCPETLNNLGSKWRGEHSEVEMDS